MREQLSSDQAPKSRENHRGGLLVVPFIVALTAIAVRWLILRSTHSTNEDFLITLRYAENLAAGRGFAYNTGEPVLGTTTPLYTLILALAAVLHLDPTTAGKSLNILADGVTVWLICRIARHLGHEKAGWLGALLYATTSAPISISIGGMETALVTCAGMASVLATVERRPREFAIASGLLFLLRIDGLLLTAILAAGWLLRQRGERVDRTQRLGIADAVLFLILVLPWIVYATVTFGSPLPASMLAKLAVYARTRPGTLPNLADFRLQFAAGAVQKGLLLLFVLGAIHAWIRHPRIRPALLWLVVYFGAMLLSRVPAFGWYFLPPLPLYFLCIGMAVSAAARRLAPRLTPSMAVAGLVVMAVPLLWHVRSIRNDIAEAQKLEDDVRRPLGEWLRANGKAEETVMLEPIGTIGYYSGLRVLDMIGLVSPQVIPCYRKEEPNPLACIVDRYRPDWLVLRASERQSLDPPARPPHEGGSGRILGEYRWVRAFPDPEFGPAFEVYRRVVPQPK